MALEAPRPLLGAGFYKKKLTAYLNNFQRKKLFCVQTLTKLPELTVIKLLQEVSRLSILTKIGHKNIYNIPLYSNEYIST